MHKREKTGRNGVERGKKKHSDGEQKEKRRKKREKRIDILIVLML